MHGLLALVLLLAVALVLPISFGLIKLYRRAVAKSMRRRASSLTNESERFTMSALPQPGLASPKLSVVDAATRVPAAAQVALYRRVLRAPWRIAAVYTVAGACYAIILSMIFFVASKMDIAPIRFLALFWIYFWPTVLTVNLVAAATWRTKLLTVAAYFLVSGVITAISLARSPEGSWTQHVLVWVIYNLPATLLLLTFLNRRVRAVGPLVLIFMIVAVLGAQLALSVLEISDQITRTLAAVASITGMGSYIAFFGFALLGFFIAWPLGWLILLLIRRLYERKKISDQSITVDAIWLMFGLDNSLLLASNGAIWLFSGLLAYVGFKVVVWIGLRLLRSGTAQTQKTPRLLLLRVFSLGKRSERLFSALTTHWRHAGSIELIAGPDLATDTVEPHEFLDFLSGKLARRFIDGPQTLQRRFSEIDTKPDQDGRFRVNDFFCHDDTWRIVLSQLVKESDAILMDLRGFTSQNRGCIFEVNELINVAPMGRVIFIIDDTTDEHFLLENVRQSWERMQPVSPNRLSASGQLQLFRFTGSRSGELRQLLRSLCIAANPA
ncbi:MAG TPA: hypothetical protein VIF64_08710 [Pyrinomonadaceae bacterium]|jgi:hypothetical protein